VSTSNGGTPGLRGKRLLVTGVLTKHSIAYALAEHALQDGAEVIVTGFGRTRRLTERAVKSLPREVDVLELDVNNDGDLEALAAELGSRWGALDGLLHAIAFAPEDALGGNFVNTPRGSAKAAFETSAFSLQALARTVQPLMPSGGSIVGLDFDASVAWPVYDWMGVAKAALEAVCRYLARDLGPHGIRVNLVSAGPLRTPAASGIPGFSTLADLWSESAPLGWSTDDPSPVAELICFLLTGASRAISGEIIHADGGFHAVAPVPSTGS
jgi:meromycolic acid enoyl-[acyl-carrier-protein] reductase